MQKVQFTSIDAETSIINQGPHGLWATSYPVGREKNLSCYVSVLKPASYLRDTEITLVDNP